jgi:hypothetical protein
MNPDELIRRWYLRREEPEFKIVALAVPIIWDIPASYTAPEPDPNVIIIRPWCGELLVSLGTRSSSERQLRRRPHFGPPTDS